MRNIREEETGMDMESVYQDYANLIYRFLYSQTHDAEWSQELMQETFLRAVTSISRYDGTCKLSVWLCQIAKHTLWQEIRKKKRFDTAQLSDMLPDAACLDGESSALRRENKRELYQAIHHLAEPEREVVLYRITGELSFREIGEILGKSENWARTVFYRAKLKLREELKEHG